MRLAGNCPTNQGHGGCPGPCQRLLNRFFLSLSNANSSPAGRPRLQWSRAHTQNPHPRDMGGVRAPAPTWLHKGHPRLFPPHPVASVLCVVQLATLLHTGMVAPPCSCPFPMTALSMPTGGGWPGVHKCRIHSAHEDRPGTHGVIRVMGQGNVTFLWSSWSARLSPMFTLH